MCERMGYAPPNGTRSWVEANLIEICRRVLLYMAELVKKIQVSSRHLLKPNLVPMNFGFKSNCPLLRLTRQPRPRIHAPTHPSIHPLASVQKRWRGITVRRFIIPYRLEVIRVKEIRFGAVFRVQRLFRGWKVRKFVQTLWETKSKRRFKREYVVVLLKFTRCRMLLAVC